MCSHIWGSKFHTKTKLTSLKKLFVNFEQFLRPNLAVSVESV